MRISNEARAFGLGAILFLIGLVTLGQGIGPTPGPSSLPPSGNAGGDLGGTYPNPTVANGSHITNASIPNSGLATPAPCSAFGTAAGTCAQGGVITAGGPTGSATVAPVVTYNAAGQLTAVTSVTIAPAIGSVTGLGAGVATALGNGFGTTSSTFTVGNDARLGAGAVTGAVKSNGSNTFGQAASSDLSDAGAWTQVSLNSAVSCGSGSLTTYTGNYRYKAILTKTIVLQFTINITAVGTCAGVLDFTLPASTANGAYVGGTIDENLVTTNYLTYTNPSLLIVSIATPAAHQYQGSILYEAQ